MFKLEAQTSTEISGDPIGDAFRTVSMVLADAKSMLTEKLEEMGVSVEELNNHEYDHGVRLRRDAADDQEAVKLAQEYSLAARSVLNKRDEWVADRLDPITAEMIEIVGWYMFFIAAKTQRGCSGVLDFDGEIDTVQVKDPQSDANGSIKAALIAVERSILAWTYLMDPANAEFVRPQIELLETIKTVVERKFPYAHQFIRPGFDEIQTVM